MSLDHFDDNIEAYFYHQQSNSQEPYGQQNPLQKNQEISTYTSQKDKRLQRNRQSAQNSRQKKKRYIEELQDSQKQLIKQIQQTEQQILRTKQQLTKLMTKTKESDSFNHDQKPTYDRLRGLIGDEEHLDEDQAMMLVELLISRVGVTGRERRRMVDYYTKRLVNFSIPAIYRYLLHASTQQKGLFVDKNEAMYQWDKELFDKVVLDESQKKKFIEGRERISRQKHLWTGKVRQFDSVREEIYNTSCQVEEVLLSIKQILSVKQIGEFIVCLEERKYNTAIALCEGDFGETPTKKVKRE